MNVDGTALTDRERQANSAHRTARVRLRALGFPASCFAILAVVAVLYTWRLDQVPPYLNQDEAGFGLASYLLATTGRDYFGNFLPPFILYFEHQELGNAMISYLAIPFVKVWGLSVAAIRLSMAVAGLISLALIGLLGWKLTGNRWFGLAGACLLATSPLFFIQSRIFLDPLLVVPFIVGWLICLAKFEEQWDSRLILLASVILGIGSYSYSTPRMLMPLYLGATLVVYLLSRRCSWKVAAGAVGLYALLMVPSLLFAIQHGDIYAGRFQSISWLTRGGPPKTPVTTFLQHYLDHWLTGPSCRRALDSSTRTGRS